MCFREFGPQSATMAVLFVAANEGRGLLQSVADVLADPQLCVLLSDEGVVTNPSY